MVEERFSKFKSSGSYCVYDGYGHDGNILFEAATTCYQSKNKTSKTSDDFIKMFKNLKHMSMTEFMWITIVFKDQNHLIYNAVFSKEKFLISNRLSDNNTVVSGNARAWLEFMVEFKKYFEDKNEKQKRRDLLWMTYNAVCELLNAANPAMFDLQFERIDKPLECSLVQSINQEDGALYEEHHWVAVKFSNVSRAMIDEFVRHRLMSYAVSSTRYVDNSNFDFILPQLETDQYITFVKAVQELRDTYNKLIIDGVKKDIARQILPLGIAQEMVVAGTIKNWKKIFDLRCKPNVHWEIKNILEKLQGEDIFK